MEELNRTLPCIPLRGISVLPGMNTHLDLERTKSVAAAEEAMLQTQELFLVAQKDERTDAPSESDLYDIGTIVKVTKVVRLAQGSVLRIQAEGMQKAYLLSFDADGAYYRAKVAPVEIPEDTGLAGAAEEAMLRNLHEMLREYAAYGKAFSIEVREKLLSCQDLRQLLHLVCANLRMTQEQTHEILEAVSVADEYSALIKTLAYMTEVARIQAELNRDVKEAIDKNQKEYVLREQIKLIRSELGEDQLDSEIDELFAKTDRLDAPEEIKEKLRHEIKRLRTAAGNSSEGGVIRGYVETLLNLPWNKKSRDNRSLAKARTILNKEHYGLEEVKERILEYLAVRLLTRKGDAPILCLVGPPGTGKTSIAASVAHALNKKFLRISLGGVKDEAVIRGHRRTYVGAMPGRIASGLKQAGVKNPVLLLDEIDKTSGDFRGAISASLLEVLDPAENSHFADNYVEVPIDLSEVLFIATANNAEEIPQPLLDRMELIEITSYSDMEKQHIAREHLIPKQMKVNGLKEGMLSISESAIASLISNYTREAGVRSLERSIARICRKSVLYLQEKKEKHLEITDANLSDFLGRGKFSVHPANEKPDIGIVRGLAWTALGGTTLEIEVSVHKGKGGFKFTGKIGEVMRESGEAALGCIHGMAEEYRIAPDFFETHDIHIHVPEGAVPKDGPSAGITLAVAMLSAIAKIPVRADLAMTGEITLRGRVMQIGGLKEKLLAAKKAGIHTVILPEQNQMYMDEVPEDIREGLELIYANRIETVLEHAFVR